jgi:hypothetical protein
VNRTVFLAILLILTIVGLGYCQMRPAQLGLVEPKLSSGTPFGEDESVAKAATAARPVCNLPNVPSYGGVHAISVYRGGRRTPVQPHFSETREIDLAVTETEAPVVLLLASYDAVIWKLRVHPKARLSGIVLIGLDNQIVVGAVGGVIVTSRIFGTRQCMTQPGTLVNLAGRVDREDLEVFAQSAFKRPLKSFQTERTGDEFWVGPEVEMPKSDLDTLPYAVPPDLVDSHRPILFGRPALERLLKEGVIRRARQQDLDQWVARGVRQNDQYHKMADLDLERTYVINSFFQLPLGLTGDASSAFILPPGVAKPKGFVGENLILTYQPYGCHWLEGFSVRCLGHPDIRASAKTGG